MAFGLYRSTSKTKKAMRCIFECILPCLIAFCCFQWFAYSISSLIVETGHIKGVDCSSNIDRKIPLASWLVLFYLIVIVWNLTIGAFINLKVPYLVLTYHTPSYGANGLPFVNEDSWKAFWWAK